MNDPLPDPWYVASELCTLWSGFETFQPEKQIHPDGRNRQEWGTRVEAAPTQNSMTKAKKRGHRQCPHSKARGCQLTSAAENWGVGLTGFRRSTARLMNFGKTGERGCLHWCCRELESIRILRENCRHFAASAFNQKKYFWLLFIDWTKILKIVTQSKSKMQ